MGHCMFTSISFLKHKTIFFRLSQSITQDGYSKREHQAQTQVQALAELEARVAALNDAIVVPTTVG